MLTNSKHKNNIFVIFVQLVNELIKAVVLNLGSIESPGSMDPFQGSTKVI